MARIEPEYDAWYLCWYLSMFPFEDALYDAAEVTNDIRCYKFVSPEFSSRILISLDPALMNG